MFNNYFQGVRIDKFERQYSAYSMVFAGKNELDEGGKLLLPASALDELARMNIVWPIMFKVSNPKNPKLYTHCGVLEFSAEEGRAYVPLWIQEKLQLKPGQIINVQNATLPKGSFVKIRPQQKAFIEISDPKAVLEQKLRNFSCLTKGDTIIIKHVKEFLIDILEVSSAAIPNCDAISIVETDVKVEFDRPLDMPPSPVKVPKEDDFDFVTKKPAAPAAAAKQGPQDKDAKKEPTTPATPSFQAFAGAGRRLDGKATPSSAVAPSQQAKVFEQPKAAPAPAPKQEADDGIVYGAPKKDATPKAAPKPAQQENKFQAFGGQGRKLK